MSDEDIPAYIGRCKCGGIVFAQVNDPKDNDDKAYQKSMSHEIGRCIRAGLTIENSTVGYARKNFDGCKCPKKTRAKKVRKT